MERNYYTEGFESFLKEKADQYKLYPSEKVWNNINRQLRPKRKWPYLAAALLLLGLGVGGKFYLDEKQSQTSIKNQENNSLQSASALRMSEIASMPSYRQGAFTGNSATVAQPNSIKPVSGLRVAYINPLYARPVSPSAPPIIQTVEEERVTGNENQGEIINQLVTGLKNDAPYLSERNDKSLFADKTQKEREDALREIRKNSGREESLSTTEKILATINKASKKTSWQVYISPTVSYRKLIGQASNTNYNYSGVLYNTNANSTDVNDAVKHKPSIGLEIGTALVYPITKQLRVKAGLQFNYNRYEIKAFTYKPELASYGTISAGATTRSINAVSYYRNFDGNSQADLRNEHFMISLPVGIELSVFGNDRVKFNVASTIQPTYIFNNQSFLISTNLKNYAQEPRLNRNWNVNAGVEAFLSVKTGTVNWIVGPQFRYQLLSSYKDNYPISEHLVDYGFKVGIMKTLK